MSSENSIPVTIRKAIETDIPMLVSIKGAGSEIIHQDRLRDAQEESFDYFVLLAEERVVGFACLVYRRPKYWSDAQDENYLPQVVDLQIEEAHRGRGYGSEFLRLLEKMAAEAGSTHLYIAVDPVDNPRAQALYLRLGYQPIQSSPYRRSWHFTDSQGNLHRGEDWIIDLVKKLPGAR